MPLQGPAAVDQFSLLKTNRRLCEGFVAGVAAAAHRGQGTGVSKPLGVAQGEIVPPAIAVVDQSYMGSGSGPEGLLQRIEGEIGTQETGALPTDDEAGAGIDNERDIGVARRGAHVGEIGHPELVGGGGKAHRAQSGAAHQIALARSPCS